VLWPRVENLLAQAADLELALKQNSEIGNLNIGATLTIGNYIAVALIAQFMQEQPGTRVSLQVGNTAEIMRKVLSFEIDLGLIEGEMNHPDLDVVPWREDELVVFCAPGHALAKQSEITDTDLLAATWIVREEGSGTRQAFEKAMFGLLPELKIMLELQHTEAIKRAVEAGLGLGCVSRVALQDALQRDSLIELPVKHRDFRRHFYFVLHRHKYLSAGIKRWLDLCREMK
jgi:DNA-binding transcriptional LysR family regulator